MKVLFVTPSFSKGGAEKNMLNIINSLNEEFEVHLCVCIGNAEYSRLINKNIQLTLIKKRSVSSSIMEIFQNILRNKPEIVFSSALHIAIPILAFKWLFRLKFFSIVRVPSLPSNQLEKKGLKNTVLLKLIKLLLRTADKVIAQSAEMRDEIITYYNLKPIKVKVISNIVDSVTINNLAKEEVILSKNRIKFVAAGSLYSAKGFDILIKAFSIFIKKHSNSVLYILGDESVEFGYRAKLLDLINQLGVQEDIFLLGFQNNPYKFFNASDVFILSSIKEGFPNVVLENLFLKKPVLVTNCVNFTNIINENNGIIIEKGSVEEMVKGLEKIICLNPSKTRISNFDFNKWFKKIVNESSPRNQ